MSYLRLTPCRRWGSSSWSLTNVPFQPIGLMQGASFEEPPREAYKIVTLHSLVTVDTKCIRAFVIRRLTQRKDTQ